ncbi:MAG: hypothetical protein D8M57_18560 [Candidatus Scalindua sp. AMX11]|nr:MAG: hypothetical protein DWQ00_02980 [Candidatus Scalindua sp.]NOG82223.1 hypothetical protein [Planctomycetota bacterium]RZV65505.1 MAG: hypothetical protein EX341_18040 [Candidatus Scalindua sp. SCAELEC01]TDE63385.1 MAG: hypothetical protein D8M57_18560 [Candidatus Scalindua sp. AMX11]GJQ57257.1 MAG: hypothetical protein SCALA701_00580 [Candidatus Scalindua sp.]
MKRYLLLFLILSSCAITNSGPDLIVNKNFEHKGIQRIAVLMFDTTWGESLEPKFSLSKLIAVPNAGSILANITALQMSKWGRYAVLDRRDLEKQLLSLNLREEEILRDPDYEKLGRSLGVDALVVGDIEKFGVSYKKLFGKFASAIHSQVSFRVNCIDVITNETVWSMAVKGSSGELNERAFASVLVAKALENLAKEID